MRAYSYEEERGGFSGLPLGLTLSSLLGTGAFFGGSRGRSFFENNLLEGETGALLDRVNELVSVPLPVAGDMLSWGIAGVIGSALALLFALSAEPRRYVTALLSLAALALFGLMLAGGAAGSAAEKILERGFEAPAALPEGIGADLGDVGDALAERTPECPRGHFAEGGACVSCLVEAPSEPPALSLTAVPLGAAWVYASDDRVEPLSLIGRLGEPEPFDEVPLQRMIASRSDLCDADAALVVGSSSSDGPPGRNEARARRRAEKLAREVEALCTGVPVYALTLGQSGAPRDVADDRALTVIAVRQDDPGQAVNARSLAEALAWGAQGKDSPLLSRLDYFGEDWRWVRGGRGQVSLSREGTERGLVPRDGAPPSCTGSV